MRCFHAACQPSHLVTAPHPISPCPPPACQVHRELEESHRSGRDSQLRMRGLEERLLAAQDECSKLNSQVRGRQRRRGWLVLAGRVIQSKRRLSDFALQSVLVV